MEHLAGQYFLNSDLRAEEITEQIKKLCSVGYESIFLHARAGLKTPYLSRKWFDALQVAIDELIRNGVRFAIWDEDNFPSGDAGNRICNAYPELTSSYLNFQISDACAGKEITQFFSEDSTCAGCFAVYEDGTVYDLQAYCGTLRKKWNKGRMQSSAYSLTSQLPYPHRRRGMTTPQYAVDWTPDRECKIVCVEWKRSMPGYHSSDLLNPDTTGVLLELTHAEYERQFTNKMKYCSSSFMDEPSVADIFPWTRRFPEEFKRDHGYDLLPLLPHLALDIDLKSVRIRKDYRQTLHRLLCQNYLEPIKNWLNKRDINSAGHLTRSENIAYSALFWPNQLRCFKYLDIPCCDPLGAGIGHPGAAAHHIGIKLVSSAARLFGKKAAGADAFAVGGDTVSLSDLKFMLNYHLTLGINWYNVHGLYYTLEGERRDEAPPSLFYQHSQWQHMKTFLDYLKKRCEELSGEYICNLELLYPSSALQSRLPSEASQAEALHSTAEKLLSHQRDFELIDEETVTEQDPVEFAKMRPYFLVAHTPVISSAAAAWLERYATAGGSLIVVGVIPDILPEIDSERISAWDFAKPYFCHDFCDKIPAPTLTGNEAENVLLRRVKKDNLIRTFLFNRSNHLFRGKLDGVCIEIAPGEAGFTEELSVSEELPKLNIPSWSLKFAPNCVPINYWEVSAASAFDLLSKKNVGSAPVPEAGKYYAVFTVDTLLENLFFITEEESLQRAEFILNGVPLTDYRKAEFRDCRELECEITSLLKIGRNTLICQGELIENAPYLRGSFKVQFPFGNYGYPVLSSAPASFEFDVPQDYRTLGYGTFSGMAVYEGKTEVAQAGSYVLNMALIKDSVRIRIDGEEKGTLIAPPYQMITVLPAGVHHISLEICNAPGNRDIMAGVPAGLQK